MKIPKDIKYFVGSADFDVYLREGKLMSVGLKWGESKRLSKLGITRAQQIKMLDWIQARPKIAKKLFGY
jgi:hypothetical protein